MKKIILIVVLVAASIAVILAAGKDSIPKDATEDEKVSFISENWNEISKEEELKPANGIWIVYGLQFIAPDKVLVGFEDGHNAHVALFDTGSSEIIKMYESSGVFTKAEWDMIIGQYRQKDFAVSNYALSSFSNGTIISFESLTKVSENIFVK